MGKDGDLWDDSALIIAFDNAMSKYKMMHSKRNGEANVSGVADQTGDEALRDAGNNSKDATNGETQMHEVKNPILVKEDYNVAPQTPEPNVSVDSPNSISMQDALYENKDYSYSQGADDYNKLLTQYYELEEKRQQIMQQLQQFGSWNYQSAVEGSCSAAQWGNSCSAQEYPTHANQASNIITACPCCPYAYQTLVAPCSSYSACSLGGTCAEVATLHTREAITHGNSLSVADTDIVRTAMGAVERAISSLKTESSENSNTNEANKEKKENEGEVAQSVSSQTDLAVVLNAWYSAGFYTGKYLVEQSVTKKHPH
ncbi:hypothetical protein SLE2022_091620 [Rubroshorea leprosula]